MVVKKRGQITLFIIAGILVLVAFWFLFYAADILEGSRISDIKQSQISDTEKSSVSFYIESVITKSFKECLHLIGEQGGRIYDGSFLSGDQYGNSDYDPPLYINYGPHKRIGIGIKSGMVVGNNGVDMYRARRGNTIVIEDTYPRGSNYIHGLNAPLPSMDSKGGDESIEQQLSDCTRRRFVNRFDITPFTDMNYDIEVLQPEPNVSVKINNEDISVETYFPVKITTGDTEIIVEDFYYTLSFKFKVLYGFIRDIIKRDMYERGVNIVELANDDYNVTRQEAIGVDPYTGLKYDVINVTDNNFELDNKHFVFSFIRENRPPDANSVGFKAPWPRVEAGKEAVLQCPNRVVGGGLVDPDEDDLYAKLAGMNILDWYEYAGKCSLHPHADPCGNSLKKVDIPTTNCDVCCLRPLVVWIVDYGEMLDLKPFGKAIICSETADPPGGGCCDDDGCWRTKGEDEPCGEQTKNHGPTCPRDEDDPDAPRGKKFTSDFNYYCDYCGNCNVRGEKVPGTVTRVNC